MNYFTEINTRLVAAASSSPVATAAGVISGSWSTHVFDYGNRFCGGQNRGRIPFVNIGRLTSDYAFDAISTGDSGGMLISRWAIEVVFDRENEDLGYAITQAIIKAVRANDNMCIGGQSIGSVEQHPFGSSIKMELVIENTHSDSNK